VTFALLILAIILLTLASAFFSCSEIAFFSLPAAKVRNFRSQLDPRKRLVARLIMRSKSLLVTIFICNTIVNVLIQNTSSDLFEGGWLLNVGLPLALVLIVGELTPKYFGLIYNETLALSFAKAIEWIEWLITPLRVIITNIASFFSRVIFFFLKAEAPLSKDELQHILESSEGKGLLHRDEAELIYGMLYLEEKQTKELMRPRSELPQYDIREPLSKLVHLFSEERLSEVSIVELPAQKMLGIVTARDLFIKRGQIESGKDLLAIIKKPFFVPETTTAKALFEQLRLQETATAWVIDEYGEVSGMITENDLLHYVLGATHKPTAEKAEYERVSKEAIVASGTLQLDELRELFAVTLESEYHMVTVGGYLSEKKGAIPQVGDTWEEEGLFFRVLASEPTRVRKVYIQRQPKA